MSQKQKFNFILLAAGKSERMGTDKALLDYHGIPWVQAQINQISKNNLIDQIYIVANSANNKAITEAVGKNINVLLNSQVDGDIFSSLQIGLRSVCSEKAVFVSPIDVPQNDLVLATMTESLNPEARAVVPIYSDKKGHPVLLMPAAVSDLMSSEKGFTRLDLYLRSLAGNQLQTKVLGDSRILLNLNTAKAWQNFLS